MTEAGMITSIVRRRAHRRQRRVHAAPDVAVRVAAPDRAECRATSRACFPRSRSPNLFRSYWRMPARPPSSARRLFHHRRRRDDGATGRVASSGTRQGSRDQRRPTSIRKEIELEIDGLPGDGPGVGRHRRAASGLRRGRESRGGRAAEGRDADQDRGARALRAIAWRASSSRSASTSSTTCRAT